MIPSDDSNLQLSSYTTAHEPSSRKGKKDGAEAVAVALELQRSCLARGAFTRG